MDVGGSNLMLIILFITFYITSYAHDQLVVNVEIRGRYVVKTGIKTYTVYRHLAETGYEFVDIVCSSATTFPSTMSVLKDGKSVKANSTLGSGKSVLGVKKYYNYSSVEELVGEYTCSLDISTFTSDGSFAQYSVSGKADIAVRRTAPICASSVGNSAYVGEKVSLRCEDFGFGTWCWNTTSSSDTEISISENVSQMSCGIYTREGNWYGKCLSPKLLVFPYLKLNLWKINVTSNTSLMRFHCNSTPPRLLYWTIFGTLGNILDYDRMDQSVLVNTSVVIRQWIGESSLDIFEEIPGGNGISMVTCSSYDTQELVVASKRLQPFVTEDSRLENESLQPTENPSLYDKVNTTTIEHSVCACDLEGNARKTKCGNHVSVAVFPLLGVILLLFITVVLLYLRLRKLSNFNSVIETPFRSQLHKTKAYVSYS